MKTNKFGDGLILKHFKHHYVLSIDENGFTYAIHESLIHKNMDTFNFINVNHSSLTLHQKYIETQNDRHKQSNHGYNSDSDNIDDTDHSNHENHNNYWKEDGGMI